MSKIDTRAVLIDEGLKALLSHGYEGAGIGPILKSAGVPKGSFYHFFESKEDFASAVLTTYCERNRVVRAQLFGDRSKSPLDRLRAYFEYYENIYGAGDPTCGCLLGNLSQSIAAHSEVLRKELNRSFTAWQEDFKSVLREARDVGELPDHLEPDEAAAFLIDAYEGALIRMKAEGSIKPLQRFRAMALEGLLAGDK
ncbi:TetR family transcriptional regulator C-terminal domain-containing protein [Phyllobacterium sp. 0TCS1.6C]|uniref:TetR/AcrR family transcriptional regulator n=1 Tax=unclassified Phyllobacterium TaxID=2638441 RepID=UPI0022655959|nr:MULTISPECIES: TetR/AcrR family transcriptional regulator [unclassified Phyllobacterium]MCX8280039.1 TetR family transcriptional regulator C-terminal domain-containing protein [Phyllobacterium sp. 0TCS1.6C]MCX8296206.1 TetR family transcriptional regulator C-terminal domain-containing protein [Phyllobacterium sp. 0TCS1.6A]